MFAANLRRIALPRGPYPPCLVFFFDIFPCSPSVVPWLGWARFFSVLFALPSVQRESASLLYLTSIAINTNGLSAIVLAWRAFSRGLSLVELA